MAGYSGKPLWQKLGIKQGLRLHVVAPPDHIAGLLSGAPDWEEAGDEADFVWVFARQQSDIADLVPAAMQKLAAGAMLWLSWPKKSSKFYIDLTEDDLRRLILPTGWVDVKVCAVDADWSGLKFLKRRANG